MSKTLAATVAVMLGAAPALAAPPLKKEAPTGSRVVQPVKDLGDSARVRAIQVAFGECVVKSHYDAARRWVLVPDLELAERRKLLGKVGDSRCLSDASEQMGGVEMRFPGDSMRHTLAEALVRRDLTPASLPALATAGRYAQPTFSKDAPVAAPGAKAKPEELARRSEAQNRHAALVYLAQFGECVVRLNPGDGLALIAAANASPAEQAAFQRLLPAFSQCLAAGESLSFNKAVLRGTIALNLYRLANAPRVPAQAAGASR